MPRYGRRPKSGNARRPATTKEVHRQCLQSVIVANPGLLGCPPMTSMTWHRIVRHGRNRRTDVSDENVRIIGRLRRLVLRAIRRGDIFDVVGECIIANVRFRFKDVREGIRFVATGWDANDDYQMRDRALSLGIDVRYGSRETSLMAAASSSSTEDENGE